MMGGSIWEFPVDEVVAAALLEAFGVAGVVAEELHAEVSRTAATTAVPDNAMLRMLARVLVGVMLLRRWPAFFGSGPIFAAVKSLPFSRPRAGPTVALGSQVLSCGHAFVR
jgi:hypothetical protein